MTGVYRILGWAREPTCIEWYAPLDVLAVCRCARSGSLATAPRDREGLRRLSAAASMPWPIETKRIGMTRLDFGTHCSVRCNCYSIGAH